MKKTGFTLLELLVLIAIIVVVMGIGFWVGKTKARAEFKQEVVQRGAAHFEVDEHGEAQCVWNKPIVESVTNSIVK